MYTVTFRLLLYKLVTLTKEYIISKMLDNTIQEKWLPAIGDLTIHMKLIECNYDSNT